MKRMSRIVVMTIGAGMFCTGALLWADTALNSPRTDNAYYVAAAKTYNMHAHDHARLLSKYAAQGKPVPSSVVKEHTAAIRANAQSAHKLLAQVAPAAKNDLATSQKLAQMEAKLAKVTKALDQLEAASKTEAADSKLVLSQTAIISQELKATHVATKEVDQSLSDSYQDEDDSDFREPDSYYATGEGHFTD